MPSGEKSCPVCGEPVQRYEVAAGVLGVQFGPWGCTCCDWNEKFKEEEAKWNES